MPAYGYAKTGGFTVADQVTVDDGGRAKGSGTILTLISSPGFTSAVDVASLHVSLLVDSLHSTAVSLPFTRTVTKKEPWNSGLKFLVALKFDIRPAHVNVSRLAVETSLGSVCLTSDA